MQILNRASDLSLMRAPVGTYDDKGRLQEYDLEPITIKAVVQPVEPEEIEHIEEGRRTKGAIKIFTVDELKVSSVENQTQPDVVLWNGNEYQVEEVKNWCEAGGYYQSIAIKIGQ
jgi:hypothetical protein